MISTKKVEELVNKTKVIEKNNYKQFDNLNYSVLIKTLQSYIIQLTGNDNVELEFFDIQECIKFIFKDYIEEYELYHYEKSDYDNETKSLKTLKQIRNYRLKKLSKEEERNLELIQSRIFNFNRINKEMKIFSISPYLFISPFGHLSCEYKITTELIKYYKVFKQLEIIFGSLKIEKLMKKSIVENFFNYIIVLKKYKEMKNEEWVKYLLTLSPEIESFFDNEVEKLKGIY